MQDVAPEQVESSLRAAIGELTEQQLAMIDEYGCRIYGNSQGDVRISIGNPHDRAMHEDSDRWGVAYFSIVPGDVLDDIPADTYQYLLLQASDLADGLSFRLTEELSETEGEEP